MSFFSRKRHTQQPAPQPAPAPAPQPAPPAPAPAPAPSQGSYGRSAPPPQQQQQQPPPQRPQPQQMQQTPQQQQPPSSGGSGSGRPRQDYPWSVRRLQVDTPMRLPPPQDPTNTAERRIVTSMSGPPLPRYGHSVPLVSTPSGDIFVFGGLVKDEVKDDLWMVRGVWGPDATVGPNGRRSTKEMGVVASLMETTGDAPGPRVGHKSALVSSVLIVWGGDTLAKEGQRNDSGLYLLNLSTFTPFRFFTSAYWSFDSHTRLDQGCYCRTGAFGAVRPRRRHVRKQIYCFRRTSRWRVSQRPMEL